jgi:hypothetical protein
VLLRDLVVDVGVMEPPACCGVATSVSPVGVARGGWSGSDRVGWSRAGEQVAPHPFPGPTRREVALTGQRNAHSGSYGREGAGYVSSAPRRWTHAASRKRRGAVLARGPAGQWELPALRRWSAALTFAPRRARTVGAGGGALGTARTSVSLLRGKPRGKPFPRRLIQRGRDGRACVRRRSLKCSEANPCAEPRPARRACP